MDAQYTGVLTCLGVEPITGGYIEVYSKRDHCLPGTFLCFCTDFIQAAYE